MTAATRDPLQRLISVTVVTEPGSYGELEGPLREELIRTRRQARTIAWRVVAAEAYDVPTVALGDGDLLLFARRDMSRVKGSVFALLYPLILRRCDLTVAGFGERQAASGESPAVSYACFHADYVRHLPAGDELLDLGRRTVVEVIERAW